MPSTTVESATIKFWYLWLCATVIASTHFAQRTQQNQPKGNLSSWSSKAQQAVFFQSRQIIPYHLAPPMSSTQLFVPKIHKYLPCFSYAKVVKFWHCCGATLFHAKYGLHVSDPMLQEVGLGILVEWYCTKTVNVSICASLKTPSGFGSSTPLPSWMCSPARVYGFVRYGEGSY